MAPAAHEVEHHEQQHRFHHDPEHDHELPFNGFDYSYASGGVATTLPIWGLLFAWFVFVLLAQTVWKARFDIYNIEVGMLSIRWKTSSFNRTFIRLATSWPNALRLWFSLGSGFALVGMAIGPVLLGQMLWVALKSAVVPLFWETEEIFNGAGDGLHNSVQYPAGLPSNVDTNGGGAQLVPVLPGITVPSSHVMYIFITLLVNAVAHESGHALAAINGDVRMESFGVLMYLVYPAAFVELNSHQLDFAAAVVRLRIASAGMWHNLVLTALGLLLQSHLEVLLSPWYDKGVGGVTITDIHKESPLKASMALGDVVTDIDGGCPLNTELSWTHCVSRLQRDFNLGLAGFCVGDGISATATTHRTKDCCDDISKSERLKTNATFLCYNQINGTAANGAYNLSVCAAARSVFADSSQRCRSSLDCAKGRKCLVYFEDSPNDRLLQLTRHRNKPVLFLGDPYELARDVTVMDYVAIHEHYDEKRQPDTYWPHVATLALGYFVSISLALGVLNILPAFFFDGQFAIAATIDGVCSLIGLETTKDTRANVGYVVCSIGTLLFGLNVVLAFWRQLPSSFQFG
eukprot:m.204646 g.204646  ORF g.204646 m.204646 type:complete len:574 (-) comp32895_c0_seq2:143-1864(-)